jgi:hypothetical protein
MAKYNVTGEHYFSITGQMLEILRQIRLRSGSPIDPELVSDALQDIVEGKFNHKKTAKEAILRLISGSEPIVIGACDGSEVIAGDKKLFKATIDPDFKNWKTDKPGQATEDTAVQVHEMVKDATFVQIFSSLGTDLDKLCLTQHQIKKFCQKHAKWLRSEGYGTFFLSKVDDKYFVVRVRVFPVGLCVRVFRLEFDYVFCGESRRRVVSPQLIPLVS